MSFIKAEFCDFYNKGGNTKIYPTLSLFPKMPPSNPLLTIMCQLIPRLIFFFREVTKNNKKLGAVVQVYISIYTCLKGQIAGHLLLWTVRAKE